MVSVTPGLLRFKMLDDSDGTPAVPPRADRPGELLFRAVTVVFLGGLIVVAERNRPGQDADRSDFSTAPCHELTA
jgi:hypothetical protein